MKIKVDDGGVWIVSPHASLHFDREWVVANMVELLKLADFITTTEQDMTMEEETSPDDMCWCPICQKYVPLVNKYGNKKTLHDRVYCGACGRIATEM